MEKYERFTAHLQCGNKVGSTKVHKDEGRQTISGGTKND